MTYVDTWILEGSISVQAFNNISHAEITKQRPFKATCRIVDTGTTALATTLLAGINIKTPACYYQRLRKITYFNDETVEQLSGEIEINESDFDGRHKGKRGRGAVDKVPIFGLLKRNGNVYATMTPNAKTKTLMPTTREKVETDCTVYSDCWRGYNALDVSEFKHYRINHSELFTDKKNQINGIENFWNQAKRHLRKFNGAPKEHFSSF